MAMDPKADSRLMPEMLTGGALGAFTGILLGLSVSDVVGNAVAGLVAILGAFFGLQSRSLNAARTWRIVSFSLVGALALVGGIAARTHDLLSPSIARQIARLKDVGYSPDQARALIALQSLGLSSPDAKPAEKQVIARQHATALFTVESQLCGELAKERFANVTERGAALTRVGGPWRAIAIAASTLVEEQRANLIEASWQLACERQE